MLPFFFSFINLLNSVVHPINVIPKFGSISNISASKSGSYSNSQSLFISFYLHTSDVWPPAKKLVGSGQGGLQVVKELDGHILSICCLQGPIRAMHLYNQEQMQDF